MSGIEFSGCKLKAPLTKIERKHKVEIRNLKLQAHISLYSRIGRQLEVTDYVMRCFLVVILVVLTVNGNSSCENICTFLYNNPDWESHTNIADTAFIQPVTAGSVTGIVTASLETFTVENSNHNYDVNGEKKYFDFLRFMKDSGGNHQPIFFRISRSGNNQYFVGKLGARKGETSFGKQTSVKRMIQISDSDQKFYKILIGDPGKAVSWDYNYNNPSDWKQFQDSNVRLSDVQTIKSDGRCTVYKYISACTDPTPRLCDNKQHVAENVDLSSSFTLSCSGSGAPFLDVSWTKDGNSTEIGPTTVLTTTRADHKIQSTITIDSITVDHLGTWTCTIMNKNFEESVTKTYELKYTYPATLVESPDVDYYQGSETDDTTLTWVVEAWPVERVTIDCGNISVTRNKDTTSVPPKLTFTLVLRMQDVVNCTLKSGQNVLETREITRVGYNCTTGEKGVGKECEVCETGETSVAGIGNCFPANSSCTEGTWGVDEDCESCPANQTSFNGTVKMQECFPDVSYCGEGQYGYGVNCTSCPIKKTSFSKAKKITECFPDVSFCEEGQYGYEKNCTSCPFEKTSYSKSKKITECFPDVSFCEEGDFGYGTDCTPCPIGETSDPKSKKITDCFIPAPIKKNDLLIPISSGAGGLLVVLASMTIACLLVRRSKLRKCNAEDRIKSRLVINTELSVVLSNAGVLDATPANSSEHVEYANATMSKQVPQNKYTSKVTENETSSKENASCDVTYAVINRVKDQPNGTHQMVPNGAHHKNKVEDPPKTGLAESPMNVMDVDEDDAYAKLGDVKRVYSFDKDEGCAYSKLERPGSSKKFKKSIKNESRDSGMSGAQPGIDVDEDPLYANVEER